MREIALGLAEMDGTRLYRELGYAGLVEYGEEAFGFQPGKTRQLARVGHKLPDLPVLDMALHSGQLGWTKVRTIGQVATPETEQAWVERALKTTSRELEELAVETLPGKPPPDPDEGIEPPRYVWARFRMDVYHFERLMQALAQLRRQLGGIDISASQLLMFLADHWREGEQKNEHTTGHISDPCGEPADDPEPDACPCEDEPPVEASGPMIHVCHDGDEVESGGSISGKEPEELAAAGHPSGADTNVSARPSMPAPRLENAYPAHYRIVLHRCPSCHRSWMDTHAGKMEADPTTQELVECDAEVVSGNADSVRVGHLSRTIPPAIRRAVIIRDQCRCQVPGCRNREYLDLHHILPRSRGGGHDPSNLICTCSAHHDMIHKDVLRVSRTVKGDLRWERGVGEPLGVVMSIWGESAELEAADLEEFHGPPGSWPCIAGYWGRLDPPKGFVPPSTHDGATAHVCQVDGGSTPEAGRRQPTPNRAFSERYPHGRQVMRIGDDLHMAPGWMARTIHP
jgi:hypothetical protein